MHNYTSYIILIFYHSTWTTWPCFAACSNLWFITSSTWVNEHEYQYKWEWVRWLMIHVLDIVWCELTVAVRITSMSVVTVDEDGNNGDVLHDGGIDSWGGAAPLVSTWITGGLDGGLGGCIWLTSKSFDVKSKQSTWCTRSDDALVERALSTQARVDGEFEDDVKHVSSDKSDTTLGVWRCRGLRRWYTV